MFPQTFSSIGLYKPDRRAGRKVPKSFIFYIYIASIASNPKKVFERPPLYNLYQKLLNTFDDIDPCSKSGNENPSQIRDESKRFKSNTRAGEEKS